MSDEGGNGANPESPGDSKTHAPKDRNCPYCGQAFTSSSLGRHLDLYIKEKNPKPADGVHDVDAIRKMRSGITRRQPRGSLAARRDVSTPGTPTGSTTTTRKSPDPKQQSSVPKDGSYMVDQSPVYPWQQPRWEATGVINDLPSKNGEASGTWDENADLGRKASVPQQQRAPSRMAQKQQLDARQKMADALDTARAAELALRELVSSFRAAKQQIDMNSLPFDFDPLALDFPALTLQCLQPPPTLFSSTPIPTSTSWSIQPPAQKQYDALFSFFQEEFRKWKHACAAATTAALEDLTYPPAQNHVPVDGKENVKKAEKAAANLEKQVNEHLQSTYTVWEQLPAARQQELWLLELARSVGRRQKELEKAKQTQHALKQESANLQSQIDQLNRLQQPREFRIMAPATIPFDQAYVSHVLNLGLEAGSSKTVGMSLNDRHFDTTTVVQRAIERWKNVIVSSRANGMNAQRPLDQSAASQSAAPSASATTPALNQAASTPTPVAQTQPRPAPAQPAQQPQQQQQQPARPMPINTNGPSNDSRSTTTATTSASVANDEGSDEDADAEMEDDDSFAPIPAPTVVAKSVPQQPLHKLQIPRTRENIPRNNAQFAMNGAGAMTANQRIAMSRPMANMNPAGMQHNQNQQRNQQAMLKNDYGTAMQGMGNGEPMYMDG